MPKNRRSSSSAFTIPRKATLQKERERKKQRKEAEEHAPLLPHQIYEQAREDEAQRTADEAEQQRKAAELRERLIAKHGSLLQAKLNGPAKAAGAKGTATLNTKKGNLKRLAGLKARGAVIDCPLDAALVDRTPPHPKATLWVRSLDPRFKSIVHTQRNAFDEASLRNTFKNQGADSKFFQHTQYHKLYLLTADQVPVSLIVTKQKR